MKPFQIDLFEDKDLLTIREASKWAGKYLNKKISESNISYLVQYGKVRKRGNNTTLVSKKDLIKYYKSFRGEREVNWKEKLGDDLNWALSFDHLREKDTTKHVHRLHPYKGKFIPQLVEYFLDDHTDNFKKEVVFKKGDIILDPFCGSGTILVQANELGMHGIGVDVSAFNALISNVKIFKYDLMDVNNEINIISRALNAKTIDSGIPFFENELLDELYNFNSQYFPTPDFRYRVFRKEINEREYGEAKSKEFLTIYDKFVEKYKIKLKQSVSKTFLDKWFIQNTRDEIDLAFRLLKKIKNPNTKKLLTIILSRTVRSCRATTHSDLATLKKPQLTNYYCVKHKKICKPLFSIRIKWHTYSKDTLWRLETFNKNRTDTYQECLSGDSRLIDVSGKLEKRNKPFAKLARKKRIAGIFSSPPYVGLINYHEQHAYAYDLYGFESKAELEIGPLYKGRGKEARELYINGIAAVLENCKKYMVNNYNVFLVANDKFNIYPIIAEQAGMKIINQYKRPVLNRTERDKAAYSEIIFHLKGNVL